MAWNGSGSAATSAAMNKKAAKPTKSTAANSAPMSGAFKGIIALLVVAIIAGLAYVCLTNGDVKDKVMDKLPKKQIAEVEADIANPKDVDIAEPLEEKPAPKPLGPQRVGELRDGYRLLPSGRLHKVHGVITSGVQRVSLIDRTFSHDSDCMLAHLLVLEPGSGVVGDSRDIYDGFEEEFEKSLKEPIVYDKDDDAYVKELKAGVQALRNELVERKKAGENIIDVLCETRDQMQQLGLYKQELENQVLDVADGEMTQQDYEDLVKAANIMLDERGCEPLELPATLKHAMRLKVIGNSNKGE